MAAFEAGTDAISATNEAVWLRVILKLKRFRRRE